MESNNNLTGKTKKGLVWSFIERFSTQGVQFVFGIILARLLTPNDYGIIAMPLFFLALAQCLIDGGFATALVRKKEISQEDLSTAFYFNVTGGVVCYFLLFVLSSLIASFYNTPILESVLKVTSLTVLFNSLCIVQQSILTRLIDFRRQAIVSLLSCIISGVVGIYMAYNGFGVWALVVQQTGTAFLRLVLFWLVSSWRPSKVWSKESFHYLWGFGGKMMVTSILDSVYKNLYPLIIGKFFSANLLGYYTRAQQFAQLPSMNLTGILRRVTFPVLSVVQDDDDRLENIFRNILRVSVFTMFPLMFFLIGIAKPLIVILLTEKWLPVVLLLQILCVGMMWYPVDAINLNLLMIKGRSDIVMKLEIFKKIIGISILFITIPMGLEIMCVGFSIYSLIEILSDTYYSGKLYNIGLLKQLKDYSPSILMSFIILILTYLLSIIIANNYILLGLDILVAIGVLFVSIKIFKIEEFDLLLSFIKK